MMAHDEIRHCGWDDTCAERKLTCGQILADNVKRCAEILRRTDPDKPILAWNNMFDPYHNARKEGWMYLAKGLGPWYGSWEGLPRRRLIVANWHNNDLDSLKFFADRGNPQILAGYYDADPRRITAWLEMAAKVKGVCGVMYTTWVNDYSQLERFMQIVQRVSRRAGDALSGESLGYALPEKVPVRCSNLSRRQTAVKPASRNFREQEHRVPGVASAPSWLVGPWTVNLRAGSGQVPISFLFWLSAHPPTRRPLYP